MGMATGGAQIMASRKRSTTPARRRQIARVSVAGSGYSSHRLHEARSLAMHAVIAARIEREPKLLDIARNNLKRWHTRWEDGAPAWHREWCKILNRSWLEIAAIMTEPSEEGARLRQSSPFAGILSVTERRRIYDAFKLEGNAPDEKAAAADRERWLRENAEAIAEYNNLVAKISCFCPEAGSDRSLTPRTAGNFAESLAASPLRGSGLKTRFMRPWAATMDR
jgi:hypothetical protein